MENSAWKDVITRLLVTYGSLDNMFRGEGSLSALNIKDTLAKRYSCDLYKNIYDAKTSILKILAASGAVDELLKRMSEVDKVYGLVAKQKADEKRNASSSDNAHKIVVKPYKLSDIAEMLLCCYDMDDKLNVNIIKSFRDYFERIEKNNDKNKGDEKDKKD